MQLEVRVKFRVAPFGDPRAPVRTQYIVFDDTDLLEWAQRKCEAGAGTRLQRAIHVYSATPVSVMITS